MSNIVCPECGASPLANHQRQCSQPAYVDLRGTITPMGLDDRPERHHSVQHLVDLLEPNPNLPNPLFRVADVAACMRDRMLDMLEDGPELAAGLRKLMEAKDCFVRQALLDRVEADS